MIWAIVTGEYPPDRGGVADNTRLLARALAAAGDDVRVWAPGPVPGNEGPAPLDPGVRVERWPGRFGPRSLAWLDRATRALPRPHRLLVAYVPHAFGWRGLNVPFCLWVRARADSVSVLLHEVAFPRTGPLEHHVLARTNELMAKLLIRAAGRVFVSTPAWNAIVRRLGGSTVEPVWLPSASTLPVTLAPERVATVRARWPEGTRLVGTFGTFGGLVTPLLRSVLPPLLAADPRRVALLLGGGGERFAAELGRARPELASRMHAPGYLEARELAEHVAAADVLFQPYPDGVTTRRTTALAPLALGRAVVTTEGPLTEPIWRESGAVALAPVASADAARAELERLLADDEARRALGERGASLYAARFAIERAVEVLRS